MSPTELENGAVSLGLRFPSKNIDGVNALVRRDRIGPYRIEATLGEGGMGIVYKGFHVNLKRQAAIKTLSSAQNADPEFRQRLYLEAQLQAALQHPNIVTVHDLIEDGGEIFIAMEYIRGRPLDALLTERQGQGMAQNEALALFAQVLSALQYAHDHGVTHRDVKPSNVLVGSGNQTKLTDFGIALLLGAPRQAAPSVVLGTPVYMSPEQIGGGEVDRRTDIYSAGVVLYEMLTGHPPFEAGPDLAALIRCHLGEVPPDLRTVIPDLPSGVSEAVAISLRKDPAERFQRAEDFLCALEEGAVGFLPTTASLDREPSERHIPPNPTVRLPVVSRETPSMPAELGPDLLKRRRFESTPIAAAGLVLMLGVAGYSLWRAGWFAPGSPPIRQSSTAQGERRSSDPTKDSTARPSPRARAISKPPAPPPDPPKRRVPVLPVRTDLVDPPSPPDPVETQKPEIQKLQTEVRADIQRAETELEAQDFRSARARLDRLIGQAQGQPDLAAEAERIRELRERLMDAMVAEKARDQEKALKRAAWERRLKEIEGLVGQEMYPEAESMAKALIREPEVPADVASKARQLSDQANAELKKIFQSTQLGPTHNKLRQPPMRPEEN